MAKIFDTAFKEPLEAGMAFLEHPTDGFTREVRRCKRQAHDGVFFKENPEVATLLKKNDGDVKLTPEDHKHLAVPRLPGLSGRHREGKGDESDGESISSKE